MSIDLMKIEEHIRGILVALGENPDREGLIETPRRVARMYSEFYEGIGYSNDAIATLFDKTFEDDLVIETASRDMVMIKDIEMMSHCEHHMALMYNMTVCVAYIPNKKIIGLSKIARIVDMVGRRLQLQERIGTDIAQIMQKITESEDVAIIIEAEHSCMTARGVKKPRSKTLTTTLKGQFKTDENLLHTLLTLYK